MRLPVSVTLVTEEDAVVIVVDGIRRRDGKVLQEKSDVTRRSLAVNGIVCDDNIRAVGVDTVTAELTLLKTLLPVTVGSDSSRRYNLVQNPLESVVVDAVTLDQSAVE